MRTDELIRLLAADAAPVPAGTVARRHAQAIAFGTFAALLLMLAALGLRADLVAVVQVPMFWVKLVFPVAIAGAAVALSARLSRPGARAGLAPYAVAFPVVAMWVYAAIELVQAPPDVRAAMVLGETWRTCPFNIALVSLPAFVGLLWAMKGLAPTRPALAGASAGLLAGAIGAAVYAMHCPEMEAPFLGVWYVLGMLAPAAAGALIGARLLRW